MDHIEVWNRQPEQTTRIGEMVWEVSANGSARGAFRYVHAFLNSKEAFAIDPVNLPLGKDPFEIEHPGVFKVFEDSLPDDWGRRLMVKKHQLAPRQQNVPHLLRLLGDKGLGALSYTDKNQQGAVSSGDPASLIEIGTLVAEAELFEKNGECDADIAMLLGAGSSPGGARPKALVYEEETNAQYIAKLPSIKDLVDVVRIEAATMDLARQAGLQVPKTKIVDCGEKPVLLVERFDVNKSTCKHMISMQTLLNAGGFYVARYIDMIKVLRRVSANPQADTERLFRQMVFNAVIGNRDDHLKNFWMFYDHEQGWRLTPAFDLVPNIGGNLEHVLFFDIDGIYPGRKGLEKIGAGWKVKHTGRIVAEVFEAVSKWRGAYLLTGVPSPDCDRFSDIDDRLCK